MGNRRFSKGRTRPGRSTGHDFGFCSPTDSAEDLMFDLFFDVLSALLGLSDRNAGFIYFPEGTQE